MVDTGPQLQTYAQGQGSVSAGNLNTFMQTCNTFADLRSLMGVTGVMVLTRGGMTIADGLQGSFYWDANDFAPDDGINTIRPPDSPQGTSGAWHRLPNLATLTPFSIAGNAFFPNVPGIGTVGTPANYLSSVYTQNLVLQNGTNAITLSNNQGGNYPLSWPAMAPTNGQVLTYNAGPFGLQWSTLSNTPATQQGFIGGLQLSNDVVTPLTVLDVSFGVACSDDQSTMITLNPWKKTITGTFTVGSGAPGLDTGVAAASTWYHVFVIYNPTTQVSDVLFSTSINTPTLPFGYTVKRYIGSFKTDGSTHILAFAQVANYFIWAAPPLDVNTATLGTSPVSYTLGGIPLGISAMADLNCASLNAVATSTTFYSPLNTTAPGIGNITNQAGIFGASSIKVLTNTSAQIKAVSGAASSSVDVSTVGYTNLTRGSA